MSGYTCTTRQYRIGEKMVELVEYKITRQKNRIKFIQLLAAVVQKQWKIIR